MWKIILPVALLLFPFPGFSQEKKQSAGQKKTTQNHKKIHIKPKVEVKLCPGCTSLYIGYRNLLEVTLNEKKDDKLILSSPDSITFSKEDYGTNFASVTAKRAKKRIRIIVSRKVSKAKIVPLDTFEFSAKLFPMPLAMFGGKTSGKISPVELSKDSIVRLDTNAVPVRIGAVIVRMEITMVNNGIAYVFSVNGPKLSPEARKKISEAKNGAKIIIEPVISSSTGWFSLATLAPVSLKVE